MRDKERTRAAGWAAPGSENQGLHNQIDEQDNTLPITKRQYPARPGGWSFAECAAAAAFGRNYIPPRYRDFQDVSPGESLAARKAAPFRGAVSGLDPDVAAFERLCREMGAAA